MLCDEWRIRLGGEVLAAAVLRRVWISRYNIRRPGINEYREDEIFRLIVLKVLCRR
jgi:hypothetical protein